MMVSNLIENSSYENEATWENYSIAINDEFDWLKENGHTFYNDELVDESEVHGGMVLGFCFE